MSSKTILARDFESSKVTFSEPKTLESGGKQAYINYSGGMFVMQTPVCRLPYGLSVFDKQGPVKYSMDLSFDGYDNNEKMKQFFDAMSALDNHMLDQAVVNTQKWFKKNLSRDVLENLYTPCIKYAKDKDGNQKPYPPTLKVQLRQKRDSSDFEVQVYDDEKKPVVNPVMQELIVKGAQLKCLIQCTGVWFAGGKFGLSWKATQICLDSVPQNAGKFTFIDDDDEVKPKAKVSKAAPVVTASLDDSDEEEESEDEAFQAKPSVLQAVAPKKVVAQPPPADSDEEDESEDDTVAAVPVPVAKTVVSTPAKTTTTKTVVKKVVKKA
jgi:hypothetical protein